MIAPLAILSVFCDLLQKAWGRQRSVQNPSACRCIVLATLTWGSLRPTAAGSDAARFPSGCFPASSRTLLSSVGQTSGNCATSGPTGQLHHSFVPEQVPKSQTFLGPEAEGYAVSTSAQDECAFTDYLATLNSSATENQGMVKDRSLDLTKPQL